MPFCSSTPWLLDATKIGDITEDRNAFRPRRQSTKSSLSSECAPRDDDIRDNDEAQQERDHITLMIVRAANVSTV